MNLQALFVAAIQTSVLLIAALAACQVLRNDPKARLVVCRTTLLATALILIGSPWLRSRARPLVPIDVAAWNLSASHKPRPLPKLSAIIGTPPREQAQVAETSAGATTTPTDPLMIIEGVWLGGVLLLGMFLLVGYRRVDQIWRATHAIGDGPAVEASKRACAELGVPLPEIRTGQSIETPFVTGIRRPTLYVPIAWASGAESELLEAVCRHEVAHLAARDLHWNLVNRLAEILMWPHPLVWMLTRRAVVASEEACDRNDAVIRLLSPGGTPLPCLTLKESPGMTRSVAVVGLGAVSTRTSFGRRIEAIMDYSNGIRNELSRSGAMVLVVVCGLAAALTASVIAAPSWSGSRQVQGPGGAQSDWGQPTDQTKTLINVKQAALTMLMYANDYDDVFPYAQGTKAVQYITFPYLPTASQWKMSHPNQPDYQPNSWKTLNPRGGQILYSMGISGVIASSLEQPAISVLLYESQSLAGRAASSCLCRRSCQVDRVGRLGRDGQSISSR